MKRTILPIAALFVMLTAVCVAASDYPAVVKIKNGCTAVCVSSSGLIMTARHCGTDASVIVDVGGKDVPATLVHVGKDAGDAPVVYDMDGDGYQFVRVGKKVPDVGDAVYCVGYPDGDTENKIVLKGKLTGGAISIDGLRGNVVDFQGMHGMSGCPLFNAAGEVIGLLHGAAANGSLYLGALSTRAAYEAVAGKEPAAGCPPGCKEGQCGKSDEKQKPVLYVFTLPDDQCPPCVAFKADVRSGFFDQYQVEYVTWSGNSWDHPGIAAAFRTSTGLTQVEGTPTFWVKGATKAQAGYEPKQRNHLISWLDGIARAVIRVPEAVVGVPSDSPPLPPPPKEEAPVPTLGAPSPLAGDVTASIDWAGVTLVALASDATPKLARFLRGPAVRAIESLSGGKAVLVIVAKRTEPSRYQAAVEAASVEPSPFYLLVLAEKQDLGLKGLIAKALEGKAAEALGEKVPLPIKVIFQRVNGRRFAAIKDALLTAEPSPFVRAEESPDDEEDVPWYAGLVGVLGPAVKLWKGKKA